MLDFSPKQTNIQKSRTSQHQAETDEFCAVWYKAHG